MKKFLRLILYIYKYGFKNFFSKVINKKSLIITQSSSFPPQGTSIADSELFGSYQTLCGLAAEDEEIFSKFRRYEVYRKVVDFVRMEQGFLYIDEILKLNSKIGVNRFTHDYKLALQIMDRIGGPKKYKFKSYGVYSPNALKYLKVYLELRSLFGDLSKFRIAEIGVGFGGQAIVIDQLNKANSYYLYDIPPVLKLTSKVVNSLNLKGEFYFMDGIQPEHVNSDLLISNDAFSELSRKTQDDYLEKVVSHASRGYMTWNSWSSTHLGGYKLADLVRLIPNSQIFPEKPLTGQENAIIVWGHDLK